VLVKNELSFMSKVNNAITEKMETNSKNIAYVIL